MTETFNLQAHRDRIRRQGWWQDRTFDDLLADAVQHFPEKVAVRAYRHDHGHDAPVRSMTFAELEAAVAQAAGAFRALGIGPGDVVGVQLPNWWEFEVAVLALNRIGAVPNPLMHIFRERELRYMLGFADARAVLIPQSFRGHDFPAMLAGLRAELPALQHVIVVDGNGPDSFDSLIMSADAAPIPAGAGTPAAPDEMSVLMYTSGTTGEPKGVMHCANTMNACVAALGSRLGLRSEDVHLGATPFGHMTGYTAVMVQALKYGGTVVLMDVWDAAAGVGIMQREGVTHMAASTAFLSDICGQVRAGARPPVLRTFLCGGAQIPPAVIEEARALLGLGVSSLWGMTEGLAGSLTEPERAAEKSASTDGRAVDGVELLVADEHLNPLPVGKTGRLYFRGSLQFLGYFKRPGLCGRGPDGWFDTGDLAYMDAEGYIRIDGRTKDIIIRGGENVPVVEIEAVLYRHPRIADAAVVGYPDPRLGERGCAVITLRNADEGFTMPDLCDWMATNGVARQYWPEAIEIIDAMPRTPNGKIKKPDLRPLAAKHSVAQ